MKRLLFVLSVAVVLLSTLAVPTISRADGGGGGGGGGQSCPPNNVCKP